MNEPESGFQSSIIYERLSKACSDKRAKADIADAVGWGVDMLDKVKNNCAGIPIDRIPALFKALGLVVATTEYMDYLARGNVIGSNCHCARMNMGECGRR
ncbi:DNA-binding protein [Paraburkholderia dioscoreae]|uniref:Phage DNA-binding protein n=1 Tax=Paraburkholderia dioscoreae TaxID=2604047 RepID=A0A5Q4Z746_9BURK|nr:DNA-binding protein [Paraburkholderia dioscoreae]VVD29185.1 Phage DNA-binding protein [Paraburkholderia dioscoreae]